MTCMLVCNICNIGIALQLLKLKWNLYKAVTLTHIYWVLCYNKTKTKKQQKTSIIRWQLAIVKMELQLYVYYIFLKEIKNNKISIKYIYSPLIFSTITLSSTLCNTK